MVKYKYVLKLSEDVEIDSAEEIDNELCWPMWSQADPITLHGVFDSFDEAMKAAQNIDVYEYVIYPNRDKSYEWRSFCNDEEPEEQRYYFSQDDANTAALNDLDLNDSGNVSLHADSYKIEELEKEDFDYEPDTKKYKVTFYNGNCSVYCSVDEGYEPFESLEEAEEFALEYKTNDPYSCEYRVIAEAVEGIDYDIDTIKIEKIDIVEFEV